jgi:alpha-D-ribose 1-methylphosphonate 5-triphosphate synthase subunit PhnH
MIAHLKGSAAVVKSLATQWITSYQDDHLPETFRAIVRALDHPGTVVHLESRDDPPAPLYSASVAVIEVLINPETPLWTDLDWNSAPADLKSIIRNGR